MFVEYEPELVVTYSDGVWYYHENNIRVGTIQVKEDGKFYYDRKPYNNLECAKSNMFHKLSMRNR